MCPAPFYPFVRTRYRCLIQSVVVPCLYWPTSPIHKTYEPCICLL